MGRHPNLAIHTWPGLRPERQRTSWQRSAPPRRHGGSLRQTQEIELKVENLKLKKVLLRSSAFFFPSHPSTKPHTYPKTTSTKLHETTRNGFSFEKTSIPSNPSAPLTRTAVRLYVGYDNPRNHTKLHEMVFPLKKPLIPLFLYSSNPSTPSVPLFPLSL